MTLWTQRLGQKQDLTGSYPPGQPPHVPSSVQHRASLSVQS